MAALDRGKFVVLFIFGVSLVAGGVAVWHLYEKGDRTKEFWGTENAVLIYHAPQVELLKLHVGDDVPQEVLEEILVEGRFRPVIDRQDISQARGLIHFRGALIEDASFDWNKPRGDSPSHWQYIFRFTKDGDQAALAIDVASARARLVGSDRELSIAPIVQGAKELIERQYPKKENQSN